MVSLAVMAGIVYHNMKSIAIVNPESANFATSRADIIQKRPPFKKYNL